jgi:hypothetical protein
MRGDATDEGKAMRMELVRRWFFISWLIATMVYFVGFLALPMAMKKVSDQDALEAATRAAALFLPITVAFGSFYFGTRYSLKEEQTEAISTNQAIVAIGLTAACHIFAVSMFLFQVILATYNFSMNRNRARISAIPCIAAPSLRGVLAVSSSIGPSA